MMQITTEAQELITKHDLGIPTAVYQPDTLMNIISGLVLVAFSSGWFWLANSLSNDFARSPDLSSPDPSPFNALNAPSSSFPLDSFSPGFTILQVILPVFGVFFIALGLRIILRAMLNRDVRAVVCTDGVAYMTRNSADAFRWGQVLTITDKVAVQMNMANDLHSGTRGHLRVRHIYTVHCHDEKTFVFDDTLSQVADLAEKIAVGVAHWRSVHALPG